MAGFLTGKEQLSQNTVGPAGTVVWNSPFCNVSPCIQSTFVDYIVGTSII